MGTCQILGTKVHRTSYAEATSQVLHWAKESCGRIVCCANVHMVMECFDDANFRDIISSADLVTADGVPLVWAMRGLGERSATRVYGPDLTRAVLAAAQQAGIGIGFYGASPATLQRLVEVTTQTYPHLQIRYAWSPPFRPLSPSEDQAVTASIRASGARVLFVGLGCPKQERWMAQHRDGIGAVMLGVGAAFDFLSGAKPQAPRFLQRAGCEWLFRMAAEPSRLWRRYLTHNPRFLVRFGAQLLRTRLGAAQ